MTTDEFDRDVHEFAAGLISRVDGCNIAQIGLLHAAAQLIAAMSIETGDPEAAAADLVTDLHGDVRGMIEIVCQRESAITPTERTVQ